MSLDARYNPNLLNLFINCIKKNLDPSKKQVILATVSTQQEFKKLGFSKLFKYSYTIEELKGTEVYHVLKESGFDDASLRKLNEKIQKASISSLLNCTRV